MVFSICSVAFWTMSGIDQAIDILLACGSQMLRHRLQYLLHLRSLFFIMNLKDLFYLLQFSNACQLGNCKFGSLNAWVVNWIWNRCMIRSFKWLILWTHSCTVMLLGFLISESHSFMLSEMSLSMNNSESLFTQSSSSSCE